MIWRKHHFNVMRYLIAIACIAVLGTIIGYSSFALSNDSEFSPSECIIRIEELEKKIESLSNMSVPIGTIMPYGGPMQNNNTQIKDGWIFCDGLSLSRASYDKLYHVIGTAFGSANNNEFNVPDLRGRFVRGVDHSSHRDPDAANREADPTNGNKGDKVGSVQKDVLKNHKHELTEKVYKHWRSFKGNDEKKHGHALKNIEEHKDDSVWVEETKDSEGGAETRPKNIYVNWIIRAK